MSKRAQRKANRQANRQARRASKQSARAERKMARVAGKQERKAERLDRRQTRKDIKADAKAQKRLARINTVREAEANLPDEWTPEEMPIKARTKAINYLTRRGRKVEDINDPSLLGAQFIEERARHIAERHDAIEAEIDDDMSLTDEEKDALVPEYEDVEEMILEEEANEFSFTGDEDNFLDPDTLGTLLRAGKAGVDKYRQKRFDSGKKAFGMTKEQWEAKQKSKTKGELGSAVDAAKEQYVEDYKKAYVRDSMPYIIGGVIVLTIVGIAIYYAGKNNN